MPKAKTNIDFDSLSSSLKKLQSALPSDAEISQTFLSTLDSISKLTKNHDDLISQYYSDFEVSNGTEAGSLKEINSAYTSLVNGVATAVGKSSIDESGSVDNKGNTNKKVSSTYSKSNSVTSTTSSGTSSPAPTVQSGGLSTSNTPKVSANNSANHSSKTTTKTNTKTTTKSTTNKSATIEKPITIKTKNKSELSKKVTSTTSSISSAVKIPMPSAKSNNYKNKIAIATAGGTVMSAAATTMDKSSNEQSQNYQLSGNFWSNIDPTEQDAIINKLEEVGYSSSEIQDIKDNKVGIPEDVLDSVHEIITEKSKKDPGLRNSLKNNYGFDIFDDDKTVNKDKLSIAMIVDRKDESDIYDMNQTLNIKESTTSNESLLDNVIKPSKALKIPVKSSSTSSATVASILFGALGISGSGAAIAVRRKKKHIKEKQDDNTEENNVEQ